MHKSLCKVFLALGILLFACSCDGFRTETEAPEVIPVEQYISTLYPFLSEKYNQEIAFYADLSRPSNQYRFFVLNLKEKKIITSGLCLNGKTDEQGNVIYSNVSGSNCSSRGAAKVSYRYTGSFGKSYKLEGLEVSNSNMFKRAVVLHAWRGVPNEPVIYKPIESQGCPTVCPDFLEALAVYIDNSDKHILLYTQ